MIFLLILAYLLVGSCTAFFWVVKNKDPYFYHTFLREMDVFSTVLVMIIWPLALISMSFGFVANKIIKAALKFKESRE